MNTINEILDYKIINISEFSINVYNVLLVCLILIISRIFIFLIKKIYQKKIINSAKTEERRLNSVNKIAKYIINVITVFIIIQSVGVDISLLLAGSAALLVGIGIGLQQIFYDFFSGLIILFEGVIHEGDVVEIGDLIGKVKSIGIRTSTVVTFENIDIIVLNSKFVGHNVINWSYDEKLTRMKIELSVAYGSDIKKVKEILIDCASTEPETSNRLKPEVEFIDFGDSGLKFYLHYWTDKIMLTRWMNSSIREKINEAFEENKIVIPFPQRDIHLAEKNK